MSAERELTQRAEAIERLLIDKGLLGPDTVDEIVRAYEEDIGPLNGARLVARAWSDAAFRERLLADARTAARELGVGGMEGDNLVAVANTADVHNVVVCTLCSCYPWPVLGLPPDWYKSPAYRARVVREPRAVLRELGLELPASTAIQVWDSSAETRYFVLPARPPETCGLDEQALAGWVTRDSMIGTGMPRRPS